MKNKMRTHFPLLCSLLFFLLSCNNFFHDLIPPDGDRIVSFKVPGQIRAENITDNAVSLTVQRDTNIRGLLPAVEVSPGAVALPVTFNYVQAAFPSADILSETAGLYTTAEPGRYVENLLRRNRDFTVPALDMPIDFSAPVDFFVISAQGGIRQYTVYVVEEDTSGGGEVGGEAELPKLLGLRFSQADNPALAGDALCWIYEDSRTVNVTAKYTGDAGFSFALVPSFAILGERLEVGGIEIKSGESSIQFNEGSGMQNARLTVWRGGISVDYTLTVNFSEDWGADGPLLLGLRFAKYDNPELVSDSFCRVSESALTVIARALYPMEMDYLSFALAPSFDILGDRLEVDGADIRSGDETSLIQFSMFMGTQNKTLTVWRNGKSKDYTLTITFEEDPDTVRSITDFRFSRTDNPGVVVNAVASIINSGSTGTITVQVFYSGTMPTRLTPRFISPGTVSVLGVTQITGASQQDFFTPLEYRVISRNGLYTRTYTVRVEFVSLQDAAPRLLSFRFSQSLNPALTRDCDGEIYDGTGFVVINAYYGGAFPPETIIPEFLAEGMVKVTGSVQISASSPQDFSRQIKYTVTHPLNPLFSRDYWVQTNLIRDESAYAVITAFGFRPDENPGLRDELTARIDQAAGKITVYAPVGSGVTARAMYPYFIAAGQVSVNGEVQTSGASGQLFGGPVMYTVMSANGMSRRDYTVEVRELATTIFVDQNAFGEGDGTVWADAFRSLQTACEAAAMFPEDIPKEIWIAAGTYTAAESFPLVSNTAYIGGFAGGESAKSERNIQANTVTVTAVSGVGVFGEMSFENLRLSGTNSAGVYAEIPADAKVIIKDCAFEGLNNGAVRVTEGSLVVSGATFHCAGENTAVYVRGRSAEIRDTVFSSGRAYLDCSGETSLARVAFQDFSNAPLELTGNGDKFIEVVSVSRSGGGVSIKNTSGNMRVDGLALRDINGPGVSLNGASGIKYFSNIDGRNISGASVDAQGISAGSFTLADSVFESSGAAVVSGAAPSVSVTVRNTVVNGYTAAAAPLTLSSSANGNITVDRVTINGAPGTGVSVSSGGTVTVAGSLIKDIRSGRALNYSGNGNLQVEGLTLRDISGYGIYISGSSGAKYLSGINGQNISGNTAYYSGAGSGSFTLDGGVLNASGSVNISGSLASITARDITVNGYTAAAAPLSLSSSANGSVTVDRVTINGAPNTGISVSSGGAVSVTDSLIKDIRSGSALNYSGNGNLRVEELDLRDITGTGINISGSGGVKNLSGINGQRVSGSAVSYPGTGSGSLTLTGSIFNTVGAVSAGSGGASLSVTIQNTGITNSTASSALQVTSSGAVTLTGVTIDGVPNGRGMSFTNGTVRINGGSVRNCTTTQNGGGIYFSGTGSLSVSGITINNINAGSNGSVIYASGGRLVISGNATINNITAMYGVYGTNLSGVEINGGINKLKLHGIGYGLYFSNCNGDIAINSVDLQNLSSDGIYISGGSGKRELSDITGYNIRGSYNVYVSGGSDITLVESSFDTGRPISFYNRSGSINISDTTTKNVFGGNGIYTDGGNIVIERVNVENVPNGSGVQIYTSGTGQIINSSIRNCTLSNDFGGGGISIYRGVSLTILGTTTENVEAGRDGISLGGAIFCYNGDLTIRNSTFKNAKANYGGGIGCANTIGSVTISGTIIENVEATSGNGGAIAIYPGGGDLTIRDSTIKNAKAAGDGGGIGYQGSGKVTISGTTIEDVEALSTGGGISVWGSSTSQLNLYNTTIKNAKANYGGGLRYSSREPLIIDGSTTIGSRFENCRSDYQFGAIDLTYDNISHEITNTTFLNCTARDGSKFTHGKAQLSFRRCTFEDNAMLYIYYDPYNFRTSMFIGDYLSFEGCTFTNLRGNQAGENYIFSSWVTYPDSNSGGGGTIDTDKVEELILRNCTFNFNAGSAGLCALYTASTNMTTSLFMDGVTINNTGGQQPLIWLYGSYNSPFKFRANNVYNGTTLNTAVAIAVLASSGVVRLTSGAMPTLVP